MQKQDITDEDERAVDELRKRFIEYGDRRVKKSKELMGKMEGVDCKG